MSVCDSGCLSRHKKLPILQIEESKLAESNNFNELVRQSVTLEGKYPCCNKGCVGFEKHIIV